MRYIRKQNIRLALLANILIFLLSGCSFTRETIKYREEFFQPVTVMPKRNHSALQSDEMDRLKIQLEAATKAAIITRDSLLSLKQFTELLLASKKSVIDTLAKIQSDAIKPSQQLPEILTQVYANDANTALSVFTPSSSSLINEYEEGLSFYKQHKYSEAINIFGSLLNKRIEETLVDNCEYWIGECHFAKLDFPNAIAHFKKVLTIDSANKKMDAYFMLGKSYEQVGDLAKARWAYEELSLLYPNHGHKRFVKSRLNAIKQASIVHTKGKQTITSE